MPAVLSGANADDVGDWRPGCSAAAEHGVLHPLLEAGVGKDEVRGVARELGVPSAEKPASPCLASRIPYGTAVDPTVLAQIDRAELASSARVPRAPRPHHGELGESSSTSHELSRALTPEGDGGRRGRRSAGYAEVEIDEDRSVRAR